MGSPQTEETLSDVAGRYRHPRAGDGKTPPEYKSWVGAKQRCFNTKHARYADYGGRGISMCPRWANSFLNFIRDMGPKPNPRATLERIDNDGDYEPGNCRWESYHQQTRNRRSNVMLTCNGVTLCLNDWAERVGIGRMTLTQRLRRGWSLERALFREGD